MTNVQQPNLLQFGLVEKITMEYHSANYDGPKLCWKIWLKNKEVKVIKKIDKEKALALFWLAIKAT